jgi:hypothetical protein
MQTQESDKLEDLIYIAEGDYESALFLAENMHPVGEVSRHCPG